MRIPLTEVGYRYKSLCDKKIWDHLEKIFERQFDWNLIRTAIARFNLYNSLFISILSFCKETKTAVLANTVHIFFLLRVSKNTSVPIVSAS